MITKGDYVLAAVVSSNLMRYLLNQRILIATVEELLCWTVPAD
jgi:hypothetical protein